LNIQAVHLLWPSEESRAAHLARNDEIDEVFSKNLGIEQIIKAVCINDKYAHDIRRLLSMMCDDPEVIGYRLDVMHDFVQFPTMCERLEQWLPELFRLANEKLWIYHMNADMVRKIATQVDRLNTFAWCVRQLHDILNRYRNDLASEGMRRLCDAVDELVADETFQSLQRELPRFREQLQNVSFITIGINLDEQLKPAEVVFLSAESKPYKKATMLSRLFGAKQGDSPYQESSFARIVSKHETEKALFREMEDLFEAALQPIVSQVRNYMSVLTYSLSDLAFEFSYFIGAAKWIRSMIAAGLPMCKPDVLPKERRECRILDLRDAILAIHKKQASPSANLEEQIVGNDVVFSEEGRIFILTGPNQGGKTTYTRSIGLAQLLFQAGIFIPAKEAAISPVDRILTHFNEDEKPDVRNGRLGEESQRLAAVFDVVTPYSLVLLNESFSSTSPGEGMYLAEDIIRGLMLIGCRAVFATHFHELAAKIDVLNAEPQAGDAKLISMVAGVERDETSRYSDAARRTYKVVPSPPQGLSYARDIARMYGISLEQIQEKLRNRGVI